MGGEGHASALGGQTLLLPVKQDGLDQGDDIAAGVVPGADDGNVDCLGGREGKGSVGSERTQGRKITPLFCWDHSETKGTRRGHSK